MQDDDESDDLLHFHISTDENSNSLLSNKHLFNDKDDLVFYQNNKLILHFSSFADKLKAILHTTNALDDGMKLNFAFSTAKYEFKKVTEWEMDIHVGMHLMVVFRDSDSSIFLTKEKEKTLEKQSTDRWASVDDLNSPTLPTSQHQISLIPLKLYLDPEPDDFASQLREFVEYQKVYGEGWVTVVSLRIVGNNHNETLINGGGGPGGISNAGGSGGINDNLISRVGVQMLDLGLVPRNHFILID